MLDLTLLMANAAQLKQLVEVGEAYPYYTLMMTLVCVSIALQVSTGSHVLFPQEALRPVKQLIVEHMIHSVFCEVRTNHQEQDTRRQHSER
jgi:hypothetical protein